MQNKKNNKENFGVNAVFTSIIGNVIEQYDFVLYGYFAPIIAKLFFNVAGGLVKSLLLTFGVFAVGFIARPIGGLVFGHIGDKYGRRKALILSIILITIPTAMIGLLPTYAVIGIWAPILLTLCRLLQGFFLSGEMAGSGVFLVESAPKKQTGFWGSLVLGGTYFGVLFGAMLSIAITNLFTEAQVLDFAWRLPFLFSVILGILGIFSRINCEESPVFKDLLKLQKNLPKPAKVALTRYPREILLITLLNAVGGVSFYLLIGYFPAFFVTKLAFSFKQAIVVNSSLFLVMILIPVFGWLSDRVGRALLLNIGALGFVIFSYLIFVMANYGTLLGAFSCEILMAVFLAMLAGVCLPFCIEILPVNVRYSVIATSYNFGMAIFGGTAPLIAATLVKYFNSNLAPAGYLAFSGLVTLVAVFFLSRRKVV